MRELSGGIFAAGAEAKKQVVKDAVVALIGVAGQFTMEPALMDDLERLAAPGSVPNFVGFDMLAAAHGVSFTPDLAALLTSICLYHWDGFGPDALSFAPYLSYEELEGDARQIELLRSWLDACAALSNYHSGDETDRDRASEAFASVGRGLLERDSDDAVACALAACNLAGDGATLVAAAATLMEVAGQHDDNATRLALTYKVLGLCRSEPAGAAARVELYDAFEAACRYHPVGPAKDVARKVLRLAGTEFDFLRPLLFVWRCAFDPDRIDIDMPYVRSYAEPVWTYDDSVLAQVILEANRITVELENRRLELLPRDDAAVALADLNNWSIDHRGYRRAIPFASSLSREANRSDILLALGHEMIHIQSAQGWLGVNLLALAPPPPSAN